MSSNNEPYDYYAEEEVEERNAIGLVMLLFQFIIAYRVIISGKPGLTNFFLISAIIALIYFLLLGGLNVGSIFKDLLAVLKGQLKKDLMHFLLFINVVFSSSVIYFNSEVFFKTETVVIKISATVGVLIISAFARIISIVNKRS